MMSFPTPSNFEKVLGIVIAIAIVVCLIIFLRIFSKKVLQAKFPPETTVVRPLGLKICIIFYVLFFIPGLLSGGAIFLLGVLILFLLGLSGLLFVGFGAILLGVSIIILILGIGLWRMNHAAWKGTIIILGVFAVIFFIPVLNTFAASWIGFPIIFIPLDYVVYNFLVYILPYILGLSMLGLLAYLVMIRDQFIKINSTIAATASTKERIQAISPGKCPICQSKHEPTVKYCEFCGYKFRQEKNPILEE